jgi:hypothetical protein
MATATESLLLEDVGEDGPQGRRGDYRCECGHQLRVFGGGRHTVYFGPDDAKLDDPVMDRRCPACGRGLAGKNQS